MTSIQINETQYHFQLTIDIDNGYKTSFYKKEKIERHIIKRKYIIFGPIIKDEVVKEEKFKFCFSLNDTIKDGLSDRNSRLIKRLEKTYSTKENLINGNISI